MSDGKWTPGPWSVFTPEEYRGPNDLPGLGVENPKTGEAVVWYAADCETGLQNDADAHLIAAAPELYEALEKLHRDSYGSIQYEGSPREQEVLSALRKAKGEPQ